MPHEPPDASTIVGSLVRLTRTLNARLRDIPDGAGLTLAELNVLGGIVKGYDLSSILVRKLLLDAPRVSRIVDSFVMNGVVSREEDPEDRRRSRLCVTSLGAQRLSQGRAELTMAMEDLLGGLTPEERAGLEIAVPGIRRVLLGEAATAE